MPLWLKRVLASLAGAACALMIAECGLRGAGWLYARWRLAPPASDSHGAVRVLCEGDSFTFGVGAPKGMSYPDQLQRLFDSSHPGRVAVINGGVPGSNSSVVLENAQRDVERYRPEIVVVMAGANNNRSFDGNHYYLFLRNWASRLARLDSELSRLRTYKLLKQGLLYRRRRRGETKGMPAARTSPSRPRSPAAELAVRAAREMDDSSRPRKADAILRRALQSCPDDPELLYWAGWIRMHRLNDPKAAAGFFRRSLALEPDNLSALTSLFEAYYRSSDSRMQDVLMAIRGRIPGDPMFAVLLRYGVPGGDDYVLHRRVILYDLGQLASLCHRRGISPVFQTYVDPNWPNETIAQAAASTDVALIDNRRLLDSVSERERYFAEDGHLNGLGYRLMAEKAYRVLLPYVENRLALRH